MKFDEIKEIFEQNEEVIKQLMDRYHITSVSAFGPEINDKPFTLNRKMNLLVCYDTMSTSDLNMFRDKLRTLTKCRLLEVYTETALKSLVEQKIITMEMSQNAIFFAKDLLDKKNFRKLSSEDPKKDPVSLASSSRFSLFNSQQSIESPLKPCSISDLVVAEYCYQPKLC